MPRKRSTPIIASYVLSLLATIALLVVWIVYVVRSVAADPSERHWLHWLVLALGCFLFVGLLVGITYQLAQTFAERRYSLKQEEFLSNVTHELKSPLAAIRLHAQTLEQSDLSAADRQASVGFVLQQAERMEDLVDDILESSRLQAKRKLLELVPVGLTSFFAGYFEEARARVEGHGVQLTTRVETEASVLAAPEALARVMDNLLDNAVRFSSRGGEVRCRVGVEAGCAHIEVEDDGIGIPKSELGKIFDRFYQIGREISGRRRGTGLGLSIVSGLVREMHGSVRAFSQEGRPGARFVVQLPLAQGAR